MNGVLSISAPDDLHFVDLSTNATHSPEDEPLGFDGESVAFHEVYSRFI
jgi:hypothetical protein